MGLTPEAITGTSNAWLKRDDDVLAGVLKRVFDLVVERGEGSWLIDVEGQRYLDFTCGIGVTNIGHCHPKVVAAVQEQVGRLIHTSVVVHHQRTIELAERLVSLVPYISNAQVFFCNTGAETIDGVVKMARRVTGRPGIIAFRRAFHGRTYAATSLTTAKGMYRAGYEPLMPGVHIAPYAIPHEASDSPTTIKTALDEIDQIFALQAPDPAIGALIVEPVLGEGGYIPAPLEFLQGLRARCDEHGVLLVFDEVQSGIGRTGEMFAAERYGVTPDVLLFAKGIASGLPLAGLISRRELFDQWPTGQHGTTFGGNPVSCAAALATLDVITEENLCTRAREVGEHTLDALRTVAANSPSVRDVRGLGLMIGIELTSADVAERVQQTCLDERMLLLTCGPEDNTLRLIPPLNATDDEFELGLDILSNALRAG